MKKLIFTFIFFAGIATTSFAQNATAKKKGVQSAASQSAADKAAAAAQATQQTEAANDLDAASFAGAVNNVQPKAAASKSKFNKAKGAATPAATPAVKAN